MFSDINPDQTPQNPLAKRYLIGDLLAEGGHGRVYLGQDVQTNQTVVIKQLKEEWRDYPELVARFVREGEALRRLNHPNIVQMLAAVEQDGRYSLVMEYMEGGSLRDILKQTSNLPEHRCVAIALELADALSRAHHLGILHRDLKPGNVLLAADGTPRLTDFGLSRLPQKSASSDLTPTGAIMGTPSYMSPEALLGEPLDARSDIWAFGVLLYELLAGQPPFEAETITSLMMQIVNEPLPPLEQFRPEVSPALSQLLAQLLSKKPDNRVDSMRQVAAYLEGVQKGRPLTVMVEQTMTMSTTFVTQTEIAATAEVEIRHNLPAQPTPFIGREAELAALDKLLAENRLVTIVGPGGMGKTRLSVAFGEMIVSGRGDTRVAPDKGIYFVPLAPISETRHIVPAVAEAVGFQLLGSAESAWQQLRTYLSQQNMLLIFDNFEHLLEGTALLADILQTAPAVKILVTSRERLQLQAEQLYPIDGLEFPDWETPEDAAEYTAVQLFLQSARRNQPDFVLDKDDLTYLTRICRTVAGMPLAIELAASWVDMLTVADIAAELRQGLDILETELRDIPQRHRSIRAAIDYSWQKLTDQERNLFQQLTVFRGSFLREAAQVVCSTNLRQLSRLVNKSFLQFDQQSGRYQIHELMRQYGAEKLAASNQLENVRDAHNNYFLDFVHQREVDIYGRRQVAALREIHTEFENIRFAWFRGAQRKNYAGIGKALDALIYYFQANQLFLDAVEFQQQALSDLAPKQGQDPHPVWYRVVARHQRPREKEIQPLREALAWHRKQGDLYETAYCLNMLGWAFVMTRNFEIGLSYIEDGLVIHRRLDEPFKYAHHLGTLAHAYDFANQPQQAYATYQEVMALFQDNGDHASSAFHRWTLGSIKYRLGDFEGSEREFRAVAVQYEQFGNKRMAARTLLDTIYLLILRGQFAESEAVLQNYIAVIGEVDDAIIVGYSHFLPVLANLNGKYQQAKENLPSLEEIHADRWYIRFGNSIAIWHLAIASYGLGDYASCRRELREALVEAINKELKGCALLILPVAALLLSQSNQPARAAELLALASHELGEWAGWIEKWDLFVQLRADLEEACGVEGFSAAWERGEALDLWVTATASLEKLKEED